jgi:ferrous iron transport protein B
VLWFLLSYPKVDPNTVAPAAASISPAAGVNPGPKGSKPIANDSETERRQQIAAAQSHHSFAGRVGHLLEPVIAPLGFNWKIGIGLIGAMAAREVFVSTMGTVYSAGDDAEDDTVRQQLVDKMRADKWPNRQPVWSTLTAISLLVYFVLAMQCISTLAVVKRETNSWKWPLFMQAYLTGLAWIASFLVYQGGRLLGFG